MSIFESLSFKAGASGEHKGSKKCVCVCVVVAIPYVVEHQLTPLGIHTTRTLAYLPGLVNHTGGRSTFFYIFVKHLHIINVIVSNNHPGTGPSNGFSPPKQPAAGAPSHHVPHNNAFLHSNETAFFLHPNK